MLRTAVCDDEKEAREYLAELIRRQHCPCEITEYASAEEYLSDGRKIDLLFLDIELNASGEEPGGMALAREIRRKNGERGPIIVFVTGYDRYVYDAFDVDAFQYLLKPVDEEKFARVFAGAVERIRAGAERAGWENRQKSRTITLKRAGVSRMVPLDSIYYIESSGHKAVFHLQDGESACYAKIGELEEELKDCFYRIHKGYLVNLAYIEQYTRTEVTLADGERLFISKYKYQDFVKAYLHFLRQEERP